MFETYRWIDFICPISLVVAFLASAPWGRKPWCMVDCCATFTFGTGLILLPQVVIGFQVSGGTLDETHLFLARHIGALLVGSAVSWYLCRQSVDSSMFGNLFYSRTMGSTLLLIAQTYSAYHLWSRKNIHFNDKYLMFACGGVACWLLGSLVQLLRYKEMGSYAHKWSWLRAGLYFDHFVLLLVGIMIFAFPSQMLKLVIKKKTTIDGVHVCLFRSVAALVVGQALSSYAAPGFLYVRDQKAHMIGRLTTQVLTFSVNIFGHFVSDLFTLYHVTPFMLTGFYITFLLTLYFRFNSENAVTQDDKERLHPEQVPKAEKLLYSDIAAGRIKKNENVPAARTKKEEQASTDEDEDEGDLYDEGDEEIVDNAEDAQVKSKDD